MLFTLHVYAQDNFVCPPTMQTIKTGFTVEQVAAACGEPSYGGKNEVPSIKEEEWIYKLAVPPYHQSGTQEVDGAFYNQKIPRIIITFRDDSVTKIISKNISSEQHFSCYNNSNQLNNVEVGFDKNQILSRCGSPSYINTMQKASTNENISTYTYAYTDGSYMHLTFHDDKLIDIQLK